MLYCMCEDKHSDKPDAQHFGAPNRYAALRQEDTDDFPPVALRTPLVCIKTGARQVLVLPDGPPPNDWGADTVRPTYSHTHYPNVDVYECQTCRARVVKE